MRLVDCMSDHYSDRIVTSRTWQVPGGPWEFDAHHLALAIVEGRARLHFSSRELSRRAGISQAYVVALERSRNHNRLGGPNPTVDVIARLAHALQIDPMSLFAVAVRHAGRHVLLVVDDDRRSPLAHAQDAASSAVQTWVLASSSPANDNPRADAHRSISLRRRTNQAYDTSMVDSSLESELRRLGPAIQGQQLGLVFAETSDIMLSLDDPRTILSFEHRWADVVRRAATKAGATAAFNVCVYERAALTALGDSVDATLDLMRSHDTVWLARRDRVIEGKPAARQILERLRPPTVSKTAWIIIASRLVDELDHVA